MGIVLVVTDSRGEEIEAHCKMQDAVTGTWHIELISPKGLRGDFTIRGLPDMVHRDEMQASIQAYVREKWIHARN